MKARRIVGALLALLLLSVTACSNSAASSEATEVQVQLSEFKFESSHTAFAPGETYRLVVTNTGQTEHELMITPRETDGLSLEEIHERSLATVHHLEPGATETVEVTFPADGVSEPVEFSCYVPGHYEAGMKLPIVVDSQ